MIGKSMPFRLKFPYQAITFLLTLAAMLAADAEIEAAEEAKRNAPNIVMILVDDMGYSDIGCYGGEIATPNIDKLAANGLRFSQCYNTARCWPTRAALMTGYYAQSVRRDKFESRGKGTRPVWAPLVSDYLRTSGYRTYHSGKWHIDGKMLDAGFDCSFETRNQGNFFSARGNFLDDKPITPAKDESGYYATSAATDYAIRFLDDHEQQHKEKPFFLYLAYIAPHFPLHALPEDIARYRDRYIEGWDVLRDERFAKQQKLGLHNTKLSALEPDVGPPYAFPESIEKLGPDEVNRPLPWEKLTDDQKRFQATKMAIHAAMIDCVDREIGRLLKQIKSMGVYDNTLIMFASDNGASAEIMVRNGGHDPTAPPGSAASYLCLGPGFSSAANTPFRRHKTWVHEGGISTPLVVHWPAGIESKGELRNTPAHVIDIVPTILDLAGIEKPATWKGASIPAAPGRSLVPAFEKNVTIDRDSLWWLHDGHRAIRIGDWKLVAAKDTPWELYDLSTDRAEANNLANKHPEKVKKLASQWEQETAAMKKLAAP